jgi:lysyl-tRNA synthetase class 2
MDIELLQFKAGMRRCIRGFLESRGLLEVDTPVMAESLIPESCLEVFETRLIDTSMREWPRYLAPSPEVFMKPLIAKHRTGIYQIGHCFRNYESQGRQHSPEFSMLEYYLVDAGYLDNLGLFEDMMTSLAEFAKKEWPAFTDLPYAVAPPFEKLSVEEAFSRYAGLDLYSVLERGGPAALATEAKRLGIDAPGVNDPGTLYDLIFIHSVEPALPKERPVVLFDYPAFVPCLAQNNPDGRTKQRWEIYINGIELANCYSEETDPGAVKEYFESESIRKENNAIVKHAINDDYYKTFENFPRCSGNAVGMDRLLMSLTGKKYIDEVLV